MNFAQHKRAIILKVSFADEDQLIKESVADSTSSAILDGACEEICSMTLPAQKYTIIEDYGLREKPTKWQKLCKMVKV